MSDNSILYKRCTQCLNDFPATTEFFHMDKRRNSLRPRCIRCTNENSKRYYTDNQHAINKKHAEYRNNNKEKERARHIKYRLKNRLYISNYHKKNRLNNPDKYKASWDRYYNQNKEFILSKNKSRVANNRARHNEYCRKYNQREDVKERLSAYRKNNRIKLKLASQRRRAKVKNLPDNFSEKDWKIALDFFNHRCAYCGQGEKLCQDHFIPVNSGGGYLPDNIVPSCKSCNSSKKDNDPLVWLLSKFGSISGLVLYKNIKAFFDMLNN